MRTNKSILEDVKILINFLIKIILKKKWKLTKNIVWHKARSKYFDFLKQIHFIQSYM